LNGQFGLYTLIWLMVLLWSANFIIGKVALREFPPLLLGALRIGLAGIFVAPALWRRVRAGEQFRRGSDLGLLLFLAACNVGNQMLFLLGLQRTSVAHSALIIGVGPIFVLLIAAAAGIDRITLRKSLGMLIALGGVAVLVGQASVAERAKATLAGDAITFMACVLFSMFAVYGKRATERHSTVGVNGFGYVVGSLLLIPVILWQSSGFSFAHVSPAGWSSLVYMALFPSLICYLIYYHALSLISASRVAAFIYLEPVIAMILAVAFLGERITAPLVAGGTIIFTGVYLTERG